MNVLVDFGLDGRISWGTIIIIIILMVEFLPLYGRKPLST